MSEAADNPDACIEIEPCAHCSKRFTSYANAPMGLPTGQPFRHELFPNDVLCIDCFQKAKQLEDGAFA